MTWHQVVLGASSQVAGEKECPCNVQCQTGRLGLEGVSQRASDFCLSVASAVYCNLLGMGRGMLRAWAFATDLY